MGDTQSRTGFYHAAAEALEIGLVGLAAAGERAIRHAIERHDLTPHFFQETRRNFRSGAAAAIHYGLDIKFAWKMRQDSVNVLFDSTAIKITRLKLPPSRVFVAAVENDFFYLFLADSIER